MELCKANCPKIAIIGAGIAGISAARTLYCHGFEDVHIFEAASRIGGRMNTVPFGDGFIEMGAQWIHGQEDNVLYDYALEKDLIADPIQDHGIEGTGSFCSEQGDLLNCDILEELIASLDEAKEMDLADRTEQNMFDYFKGHFDHFLQSRSNLSDETVSLLKRAFRWFIMFEAVDNSCDNLRDISPLSYTEWEDCDGVVDLVNLKDGYRSILDELRKDFPLDKLVHLRRAVNKIIPTPCELSNRMKVKLCTAKLVNDVENGHKGGDFNDCCNIIIEEDFIFDHVIVTSSIGFLKANLETGFFGFALPSEKIDVIRALGFGGINKIFLQFEHPFWFEDEKGFQILWNQVNDEHCYSSKEASTREDKPSKLPAWAYCIQGFDPVRGHRNVLMAWIGSYGARQMEALSDYEIGLVCGDVLRQVIPRSRRAGSISNPCKVQISRWHSHPYVLGSYSNRTVAYERLKLSAEYNVDILAKPIRASDLPNTAQCDEQSSSPLVLFAGEATDRVHYSTTDGAFRSGTREAITLIHYYNQ